MQITVNGTPREIPDGTTLSQLLAQLQLAGKRIAVECNRDIVPRSQHETTQLQDGDIIEIVHAIGGG